MNKTGTTESGSQVAGEHIRGPYDRPSVTDRSAATGGGAGGGAGAAAGNPMPQAMCGLTGGGDLGATSLAGMGGAGGGGAALGDEGFHGSAAGVAGRAGDYAGARYAGGREAEETGLQGSSRFGHTTADAPSHANRVHASSLAADANAGYSSGLGSTGAQGAGASAETAHLATGGKAGLYPPDEHVDPYETGAAGGGGGDEAGDEP